MFTNDFCEDWDSTENQDNFIKTYFNKKKVDPQTKSLVVVKSSSKHKNTDIVKDSYSVSNPVKHEISNTFGESSRKNYSEMCPQSQDMLITKASNSELNHLKNKRKRKRSKNKNRNISNETLEVTKNIEDSKTETITNNFFINSIQNVDLHDNETDSNCSKLKMKKKKIRNKAKNISEEKSFISDGFSDSMLSSNLPEKNSNSDCFKKKKIKKSPESDKAELVHSSNNLSVKKRSLIQNKAYQKLQAAKFRYLNEMLYTNSGKDALSYFQENTEDFVDYHDGYQSQVSKWPINPVDIIIQEISKMNKQAIIADLGCGEAKIAEVFPNRTIYSFDLIALKDCVTACDIANVPLAANSVDVVVFCLSLMGTNWKDYLKESCRILKPGGIMKIAEIESRIDNLEHFIKEIENFGFSLINQNVSHKMFVFLNFKRINRSKKSSKIPAVTLKPCLYKKR